MDNKSTLFKTSFSDKGNLKEQTMDEKLFMLIWAIGILCIAWTTIKELRESNETLIIKAVCLVLTLALAPLLAVLQGVWSIK